MNVIIVINVILAFLIPQTGGQPEVLLSGVPTGAVDMGHQFNVEVRVIPGDDISPERVRFLPLALENLSQGSSHLTVDGNSLSYEIELVAGEEGNAAVGELQFEILPPDTDTAGAPQVFYHQGFSLQIVRPLDWTWGGLLAGVFLIFVVLGAVLAWRKQKKNQTRELIRTDARRKAAMETLEEIQDLRISGEWEQVVEKCYQALNRQVSDLAVLESIPEPEARTLIFNEIKDSEGLGRLGEEVRYADHKADLSEARFAEQVVQRVVDFVNKRHEIKE